MYLIIYELKPTIVYVSMSFEGNFVKKCAICKNVNCLPFSININCYVFIPKISINKFNILKTQYLCPYSVFILWKNILHLNWINSFLKS